MHTLSIQRSEARMTLPIISEPMSTKSIITVQGPSPCGLSREELRQIVLDLIG